MRHYRVGALECRLAVSGESERRRKCQSAGMIRRLTSALILIASLVTSATAQERVIVATTRDMSNAALFLAAARGYFKDEGLQLEMRAYPDAPAAAEALGLGAADLALTAFSATAFSLAASGKIKAIAAQVREWRGYEGNQVIATPDAYRRGLHSLRDLAGKSVALNGLGSVFHYELAQIAQHNGFKFDSQSLKALPSFDAVAQAVIDGKVDAAILPPLYVQELLSSGQARPIGWFSELGEHQLGALFASAKTLANRRDMVKKFLIAYRRGAADYVTALLRHDSYGKRRIDAKARDAAAAIGLYLFPGRGPNSTIPVVSSGAYYMDAEARLDLADIERQVAWFKAHGLIAPNADAHTMVDMDYVAGR